MFDTLGPRTAQQLVQVDPCHPDNTELVSLYFCVLRSFLHATGCPDSYKKVYREVPLKNENVWGPLARDLHILLAEPDPAVSQLVCDYYAQSSLAGTAVHLKV